MCGAVRASPLLRSLLICQVACRLEWCIAAKTQRQSAVEQHTSREGSQVDESLLGVLKGSFPRHTPEGQTEVNFLQGIKKSSKSTYKPQKMLFLSLFYLQFAVRNSKAQHHLCTARKQKAQQGERVLLQ